MLPKMLIAGSRETKFTYMTMQGQKNSLQVECLVVSQAKTASSETEEKSISRKIQSSIDISMETRIIRTTKASTRWIATK